jgi:hypothetical protein
VAKWTNTTSYPNLASPADDDLLPIADVSEASGSQQRTITWQQLTALAAAGAEVSAYDPTADDDEGDGYALGSVWYNDTDGTLFVCVDPTAGYAVWDEISTGGGGSVTSLGIVSNVITSNMATAAVQTILNAVEAAGGGVVEVAAGVTITVDDQLVIPSGVTLQGTFEGMSEHNGIRDTSTSPVDWPSPGEMGTVIEVTADSGVAPNVGYLTTNAAIVILQNAALRGFLVYHPNQVTDTADVTTAPTNYPYAIAMRRRGCLVENIELVNARHGIDASYTSLAHISRVTGQPLGIGILADYVYDILYIDHVHFNPWYAFGNSLYGWQRRNGVAFRFYALDWLDLKSCFAYGYHVGFRFTESSADATYASSFPGGRTTGTLVRAGADVCSYGFVVDAADTKAGVVLIAPQVVSKSDVTSAAVGVLVTGTGILKVMGGSFWSDGSDLPSRNIFVTTTAGSRVIISDCTFEEWNASNQSIYADKGTLTVMGCQFLQTGSAVVAATGTSKAVVVGNIAAGGSAAFTNGIGAAGSFANNI